MAHRACTSGGKKRNGKTMPLGHDSGEALGQPKLPSAVAVVEVVLIRAIESVMQDMSRPGRDQSEVVIQLQSRRCALLVNDSD